MNNNKNTQRPNYYQMILTNGINMFTKPSKSQINIIIIILISLVISPFLGIWKITAPFYIALTLTLTTTTLLFEHSLNFFKTQLRLDPEKELFSQPLLSISILFPIYLFLSFGFYFWKGYEVSLTKAGFETFIAISQLPLWLLTTLAPLTILVARAHTTAQTAHQIEVSQGKNNLDHYFTNRKEFNSAITNTRVDFKKRSLISKTILKELEDKATSINLSPSASLHDKYTNGSRTEGVYGENTKKINDTIEHIQSVLEIIFDLMDDSKIPDKNYISGKLISLRVHLIHTSNSLKCSYIKKIIDGAEYISVEFVKPHDIQTHNIIDLYNILLISRFYIASIMNFYGINAPSNQFINIEALENIIFYCGTIEEANQIFHKAYITARS